MPSFDAVRKYAECLSPAKKSQRELRLELAQQRRLNRRSRAFADRVEADKAFFRRFGVKL
jgi:hypothetical protein